MSELTLEQAMILLDESRQHNAAMLNRLYESLGIDSSDGEIRFKWAMIAIEDVKRERDSALAQNAELVAMVDASRICLTELKESYCRDPYKSTADERVSDGKLLSGVYEFIKITPTQHLRDRDAEVGRAGFVAGVNYMVSEYTSPSLAIVAVDEYAEKVRRGEV